MMDDPASVRLLNASAMIEIEPLMIPASILMAKSRTFRMIPITPQRVPYALLTAGDEVSELSLMKIFESRVIKISLRKICDVKRLR